MNSNTQNQNSLAPAPGRSLHGGIGLPKPCNQAKDEASAASAMATGRSLMLSRSGNENNDMNGFGGLASRTAARKPNARAAAAGRSLLSLSSLSPTEDAVGDSISSSSVGLGGLTRSKPTAAAASAGRSLLDRPRNVSNGSISINNGNSMSTFYNPRPNPRLSSRSQGMRSNQSLNTFSAIDLRAVASLQEERHNSTFSASAAHAPLRRVSTTAASTLKSCLSSSSMSKSNFANNNGFGNGASSGSRGNWSNEEFKMIRNVSFSHESIREYEVTTTEPEEDVIGNPTESTGSAATPCLGWRYNPQEKIKILAFEEEDETTTGGK